MRDGVKSQKLVSRLLLAVLLSSVAACSSDAMRFSETPFGSPFGSSARVTADPVVTGSAAVPSQPVYSQPLSSPQSTAGAFNASREPRVISAPQKAAALAAAPSVPSVPSLPTSSTKGAWTAQGGTSITVARGETLDVLAARYGVPASALLSANGLKSAAQVAPGRDLVIPVFDASGASASASAPALTVAPPVPAASRPFQQVAAPIKPAPEAAKPPVKVAALVPQVQPPRPAKAEPARSEAAPQKLDQVKATAQTRTQTAALDPKQTPKQVVAKPEPAKPVVVEQPKLESPKVEAPKVEAPKAVVPKPVVPAATPDPQTTASLPAASDSNAGGASGLDFRWPARGRVIQGFSGRGGSEGINIALPEGTPVKAAEGGVVAYSGSELKGYGNLVLIRHDNGYVSAYAHNGELSVKRGERVKRGQVIAKSGQSGNVNSPQLHFEIRKGANPVDPMPYLSN